MANNSTKYAKRNLIIIAITVAIILSLTIGYSVLTKQLEINSSVTIRAEKDIRITKISDYGSTNGGYEVYNAKYTSDTFTANINLPNLTSKMAYNITITNKGTKNMKIKQISSSVFNNTSMSYSLTGASKGTIIESNSALTFTITFRYKTTITNLPENQTLGAIINLVFEEYIYQDNYISDGNILDLRGDELPVGGKWVDIRNNRQMNLYNVVYDNSQKEYDFSGNNAYATLGEPLLPETGDFTLEALIKTPAIYVNNDDQAIISQVDDAVNDTGRFKLNWRYNGDKLSLIVFFNSQVPSTNQSLTITNKASTSTQYLIQVVRIGNKLNIYLDGLLISSNNYDFNNVISQGPFKISRWNDATNQYYKGQVLSVRVYDRALSAYELNKNYELDFNKYIEVSNQELLKTFVLSNQIVTSGDGLYDNGSGIYKYRGLNVDNYIKFIGDDDLYRIISFNNDGTIKLINSSIDIKTAFDTSGHRSYDVLTSSYCSSASTELSGSPGVYYGCNYFGTTEDYNGKNVPIPSTAKIIVDNWYNNLSPTIKSYIIEHNFNVGFVPENASYSKIKEKEVEIIYNGYVGFINVSDVIDAMVNPASKISSSLNVSNYLSKIATNSTGYWTMNGYSNNTFDVWTISYGTQLAKKRASRTNQLNGSITAYFGIKPVFFIDDDILIKGTGTTNNPFIIMGRQN